MLAVAKKPRILRLGTEELKRRREALGLTMEQAADAAGMEGGRGSWWMIESGRRANVTIETLGRLAVALQCDPADLLK